MHFSYVRSFAVRQLAFGTVAFAGIIHCVLDCNRCWFQGHVVDRNIT